MIASSAMIHPLLYDRIPAEEVTLSAETPEVEARLKRHMPPRLGGQSKDDHFTQRSLQAALADAYTVTDEFIAQQVHAELALGRRPLIVCRTHEHAREMKSLLLQSRVLESEIWAPQQGSVIASITEENNTRPNIRVGIVPICSCTGYSATWFNSVIRGVFPSNEANREQIVGRVRRNGQTCWPVRLITIHCGVTSLIMRRHLEAAALVRLMDELNAINLIAT